MPGRHGCLPDSKQATTTLRLKTASLGRKAKQQSPLGQHASRTLANTGAAVGGQVIVEGRVLQTCTVSLQRQPRTQQLFVSLRSQPALFAEQGLTHANCARAPRKPSISKSRLLLWRTREEERLASWVHRGDIPRNTIMPEHLLLPSWLTPCKPAATKLRLYNAS